MLLTTQLSIALVSTGLGCHALPRLMGSGERTAAPHFRQLAELQPREVSATGAFGESVAASGTTIVVGDPGDNDGGGRAYVFTKTVSGWRQSSSLVGLDTAGGDGFGQSVAISGNTVVVGAPGHDHGNGRAYVFTGAGGSWHQAAELKGSGTSANAIFGISVAVSGGTVLVGAPNVGQAFVFSKSGKGWPETAEISGPRAQPDFGFGSGVAISGTTAVVGSPSVLGSGAAYLYRGSSGRWQMATEFRGLNPVPFQGPSRVTFGRSVAISGNTVVVAAPADSDSDSGAFVFVTTAGGWRQAAVMANIAGYGTTESEPVAVWGNVALAGGLGSAYMLTKTGGRWVADGKLTPKGAQGNYGSGLAVAIWRGTIVIGAGNNPSGGRAYVFGS